MIGSVVYELAPTPNNPRNSEGSFGRAPDGSILFVYNRYTEGQADDAKADLAVLTSRDDGRSWENSGIILSADDLGAMNLMGSSLLTLDNGDLEKQARFIALELPFGFCCFIFSDQKLTD